MTFFVGGGASFGVIGGSEGTDFFVTIENGMFGKEGGGGRPEGSAAKLVKGGGGAVVFREGLSFFFGEGGFPRAMCLTLAIFGSSEDIKNCNCKIIRYDN